PQASAILGPNPTNADIIEALRNSGLTRAEAQARREQCGDDPPLGDRDYDAIEGMSPLPDRPAPRDVASPKGRPRVNLAPHRAAPEGMSPLPDGPAPSDVASTMAQIGVILRADSTPVAAVPTLPPPDPEPTPVQTSVPGQLPIFGRELFTQATTQFQPITTGPVDPDYRLGPGDQLFLILSGDVEAAHTLEVTREGFVFIPD